ncbi:flagellin [Syntrophotalea carbinolica DSM 2380]|uniref:Flagellin n=1 Tax=Syntrophotalea carbinolica (strain DSM 2380 / NBRC 103641 / GraBd1) TaxID=338963 RepID=Q3A6D9_SYNC1|nr:flagellin [Syntrophotalea carbinolica]ABA88068.1 flagellin [Syntrophotalea carbinolica DSM 2380]
MPFVINTNPLAQIVQNNLGKTNKSQADAMRRLSSGLRINSAKDDPAGLAKSNRVQTEIRSQNKVIENLNQGVGYAQFADATLEEIGNLIQRGRELAVQAANSTLSDSDRQSLNEEFGQIKEQIDQLAQTSSMFGQYPLGGDSSNTAVVPSLGEVFSETSTAGGITSGITLIDPDLSPIAKIPQGATNVMVDVAPEWLGNPYQPDIDIQVFTVDGKHLVGTGLGDFTWESNGVNNAQDMNTLFISESNGFASGAAYDPTNLLFVDHLGMGAFANTGSYGGMNFTYSGDGDSFESIAPGGDPEINNGIVFSTQAREQFTVDEATEDLLVFAHGAGQVRLIAEWSNMPEPSSGQATQTIPQTMKILANTTANSDSDYIDIQKTPADLAALGLESVVIDPPEAAEIALTKLAEALQIMDNHRSYYGATMTSLEGRISATAAGREANSASLSRILDADFSTEVSELTKADVLQQAGASIMAQANSLPQISLELLKM